MEFRTFGESDFWKAVYVSVITGAADDSTVKPAEWADNAIEEYRQRLPAEFQRQLAAQGEPR